MLKINNQFVSLEKIDPMYLTGRAQNKMGFYPRITQEDLVAFSEQNPDLISQEKEPESPNFEQLAVGERVKLLEASYALILKHVLKQSDPIDPWRRINIETVNRFIQQRHSHKQARMAKMLQEHSALWEKQIKRQYPDANNENIQISLENEAPLHVDAEDIHMLWEKYPHLLDYAVKLLDKAYPRERQEKDIQQINEVVNRALARSIIRQSEFVRANHKRWLLNYPDFIGNYVKAGFNLTEAPSPIKAIKTELQSRQKANQPITFIPPLYTAIGNTDFLLVKQLVEYGVDLTKVVDRGFLPVELTKILINELKEKREASKTSKPKGTQFKTAKMPKTRREKKKAEQNAETDESRLIRQEIGETLDPLFKILGYLEKEQKTSFEKKEKELAIAKREAKRQGKRPARLSKVELVKAKKVWDIWVEKALPSLIQLRQKKLPEIEDLIKDLQISAPHNPDKMKLNHRTSTNPYTRDLISYRLETMPSYKVSREKSRGRLRLNQSFLTESSTQEDNSEWIDVKTKKYKTFKPTFNPFITFQPNSSRGFRNRSYENVNQSQPLNPSSFQKTPHFSNVEFPSLPQKLVAETDIMVPGSGPWGNAERLAALKAKYKTSGTYRRFVKRPTKAVNIRPAIDTSDTYLPPPMVRKLPKEITQCMRDLTAEYYRSPRTRRPGYHRTVPSSEIFQQASPTVQKRIRYLMKRLNRINLNRRVLKPQIFQQLPQPEQLTTNLPHPFLLENRSNISPVSSANHDGDDFHRDVNKSVSGKNRSSSLPPAEIRLQKNPPLTPIEMEIPGSLSQTPRTDLPRVKSLDGLNRHFHYGPSR